MISRQSISGKLIQGFTPSSAQSSSHTDEASRGLGYIRGEKPTTGTPYTIEKISPTKRKGSVVAHAIVLFGPAWVRYRIVNSERGLCVFPPANPCPGPSGRTFYRKSAGIEDVEIRDRLREDIITAYKRHLATVGRRAPRPLPKRPSVRNRIKEALEALADEDSPLKAGRRLMAEITEVIDDVDSTTREKVDACSLLIKLFDIDTRRLTAVAQAVACEFRDDGCCSIK